MADFTGTLLTQKGRNLLSKAQTGATLTFTKIKIGDGTWATGTDPTQLNDLVDPKLSLSIQSIQVVGDGTVRLRFVLTNTGLQQGFFMREIGIYAQDPDLGEILYAVAYAGDRADYIPSDGTTKVENVVDIYTVISNTQNVSAVISDTVVIATKQDVDNLNTQLTNQINTVNTQLTNQINTVKPEIGTTSPSLTYPGKLWFNTNTNFLQYYDGSNWQNVVAANADTVDGFHASQTPAPNMIPVANNTGTIASQWISASTSSWRKIAEISVSSNVDYVDITGLNINNDKVYVLFSIVKNPTSTAGSIKLYIEGDTNTANYYSQRTYSGGSSVYGARENIGYIGISSGSDVGMGFCVIMKTSDNIPTWTVHWNRNIGSSIETMSASGCCISSKSNITTIRIVGAAAGGIGAGSYFLLCSAYR
jgi:hypothetical protein